MADGTDKVVWAWPEGVKRRGLWAYVWPADHACFHRYHEDGTPWCGGGPRYKGETKTPGGPWCRACLDSLRHGFPEDTTTTEGIFLPRPKSPSFIDEDDEGNGFRSAHVDALLYALRSLRFTDGVELQLRGREHEPLRGSTLPLDLSGWWEVSEADRLVADIGASERELLELDCQAVLDRRGLAGLGYGRAAILEAPASPGRILPRSGRNLPP